MRHSLTLLYLFIIAVLFAKQVRAPLPHPDVTEPKPEPEPEPEPVSNPSDSGYNSGDEGDDTSIGGTPLEPVAPAPAAPVGPPAEGNEAEFEEEDVDYSEILEHVSDLLDAITSSIISELDGGLSTTVSAPLPTAALPCYSVSSIYNECGLHNSVFPNVIFPIQASCLCYHTEGNDSTATWAPSIYDGYMSSCNNYAQTQKQASITSIGNSSSVFNLCSSAGDVRATPALAAASSTTTTSATPAAKTTTASTPTSTSTIGSAGRMSISNPLIFCTGLWLFRLVM